MTLSFWMIIIPLCETWPILNGYILFSYLWADLYFQLHTQITNFSSEIAKISWLSQQIWAYLNCEFWKNVWQWADLYFNNQRCLLKVTSKSSIVVLTCNHILLLKQSQKWLCQSIQPVSQASHEGCSHHKCRAALSCLPARAVNIYNGLSAYVH